MANILIFDIKSIYKSGVEMNTTQCKLACKKMDLAVF